MPSDRKVAYFYDPDPSHVHYGHKHPMKPHRITMAHSLLMASPFWPRIKMITPAEIGKDVVQQFHSEEYVDMLSAQRSTKVWDALEDVIADGTGYGDGPFADLENFGIQEDCPIFDTVWDFSRSSGAMSIGAAAMLNHGLADVGVNWAGGLHHARMDKASGFCYVNDIVLGILELLKYHQRVMYIDIDVHHGDGVEEAFLNTDRCLTVSFHKYALGDREGEDFFFPGTGDICDIGPRDNPDAIGYAVNVPLANGLTDDDFAYKLFQPVIAAVMDAYAPTAIVLQSGADSVAGDKIGNFNLSTNGHASAGRWLQAHYPNVPLMVLGGGGYTISNVARTWCYETIAMLGVNNDLIPQHCPMDCFYWEHVKQEKTWEAGCVPFRVAALPDLPNANPDTKIAKIVRNIKSNLRQYVRPVSVPFRPVARDTMTPEAMARAAVRSTN